MNNVLPLFDSRRARMAELRQWFTEQAQEPSGQLAAVSVAITGNGMLTTSGRGIDPDHAVVLLRGLKSVVARLEAVVSEDAAHQIPMGVQSKVIHLTCSQLLHGRDQNRITA